MSTARPITTIEMLLAASDLAVEVLSPSDTPSALVQKAEEYFAAGCRAVWIIDPVKQTLTIHEGGQQRRFEAGETVSEIGLLPGFTLELAALFARGLGAR